MVEVWFNRTGDAAPRSISLTVSDEVYSKNGPMSGGHNHLDARMACRRNGAGQHTSPRVAGAGKSGRHATRSPVAALS